MLFCGKKKALTFSFDDGNQDDIRLVELFQKYGLKGTFHLNSGRLTAAKNWQYGSSKDIYHINYFDHPHLYDGQEIACHGYSHAHLPELDPQTLDNEIRLDKRLLELLYGCRVRGMSYPYGGYNEEIIRVLVENGLEYSRTVESTHDFFLPERPLVWHPTCHCQDPDLFSLADRFLSSSDGPMLFYIWGHSYEFASEAHWESFEALCRMLGGREDIFYGTNIEILDCIR